MVLTDFNGAVLFENYILYQIFNNIVLDRNLDIQMQSNIREIKSIYMLDEKCK